MERPLGDQSPGGAGCSHLVLWVGVGPAAGAVQPKEVLTVFIQTVDLVPLLQNKVQRSMFTLAAHSVETPAGLTGESLHWSPENFLFPQSHLKFLQSPQETPGHSVCVTSQRGRGAGGGCSNVPPFGVEFKEVVTLVTLVGAGQTHAGRLASLGRAGAAGVERLPLHVALHAHASRTHTYTFHQSTSITNTALMLGYMLAPCNTGLT